MGEFTIRDFIRIDFTLKKLELENIIKNLRMIPGIGPKLAKEFAGIGIERVSDLKAREPDELYSDICAKKGSHVDRCVLYVCRLSVYFAENENPDPEKLKWWYWKDKK